MTAFASRNLREILRDPLTLLFGAGLPLVLILFISLLQRSIPAGANAAFAIGQFAPAMAVFSFSFVALFSGLLVAGDRRSAYLTRLFASPLTARDFIFGYVLPVLPVAMGQAAVCFLCAALFGLRLTGWLLLALAVLVPTALMFTFFGLLFGSLLSDKQLGGIFSIFVNVTTWLSGTWFDPGLIGGAFRTVCDLLPFAHAVEMTRAAAAGNPAGILPHLWWVLGYAVAAGIAAVLAFRRKMKS